MLYFAIHWRGRTQRGTDVYLHKPRLKIAIDQDVESVELKATSSPFLRFRVDVQHYRLGTDACFDYNVFDIFEELN